LEERSHNAPTLLHVRIPRVKVKVRVRVRVRVRDRVRVREERSHNAPTLLYVRVPIIHTHIYISGSAVFNRRCSLTGMLDIRHQSARQ
jgi:hypothetical protein